MPAIPPSRQPFDLFGPAPTSRMSFMPFGTYADPDGSEHLDFAVPSMITEPINALQRLAQNSLMPDGSLGIPNEQNLGNQHDVSTLLQSLFGGNAMNPGRLMEDAAAAEAPAHLYRGAPRPEGLFQTDRPLFMSSSPDVAGTYADSFGSVAPMKTDFQNPLTVDAQGRNWNDIPFNGTWTDSNALTYLARDAGHDGLVIKNVIDHLGGRGTGSPGPADTVVALKRGTVTSPLTGETLFSDTGRPSPMGSALAGAEGNAPRRAFHGTTSAFDHFNTPSVFAASDPEMASNYALYGSSERPGSGPNIIPLDMHGSVFDASSVPLGQNIRHLAEQSGHPIIDWGDGAYEAIRPGTVTSPLTGETLFSDQLPSLFGGLLQDQNTQIPPRNALLNY